MKLTTKWIHCLIGITLMFCFRFLPPVLSVTELGMQVLGVFLGALYLWTTVGILWPSLLCLAALAVTDYATMNTILQNSFGQQVVIMMLLLFPLVSVIEKSGIAEYPLRWLLTRPIFNGRPWLFTFLVLFIGYILCFTISGWLIFFMTLAFFETLCNNLNIQKGNKFASMFVFGVVLNVCMASYTIPFKGMGMILVSTLQNINPEISINYATFALIMIIMNCLTIIAYVLFMKVTCPPNDVAPLKNLDIKALDSSPLPPMNSLQKFMCIFLAIFTVSLFLPFILPKTWAITKALSSLTIVGITMIGLSIFFMFNYHNEPIAVFSEMAKKIPWDLVFLCASAMCISSALTAEGTGISQLLSSIVGPLFIGKSPFIFMFLICLICILLTNIANNGVISILLVTIGYSVFASTNDLYAPMVVLITYCANMAFLLPASSMFASVAWSNEWITPSLLRKTVLLFLIPVALVLSVFVGYPLTNLLL